MILLVICLLLYRKKSKDNFCVMPTGWFSSQHVVHRECHIHGSMEIEKRAIWFDIRLITCQRGDGTLSIRANCLSYLNFKKACKATVLISDPRSVVARCRLPGVTHGRLWLLDADQWFSSLVLRCFCCTLGKHKEIKRITTRQGSQRIWEIFQCKAFTFFFYLTLQDIIL